MCCPSCHKTSQCRPLCQPAGIGALCTPCRLTLPTAPANHHKPTATRPTYFRDTEESHVFADLCGDVAHGRTATAARNSHGGLGRSANLKEFEGTGVAHRQLVPQRMVRG